VGGKILTKMRSRSKKGSENRGLEARDRRFGARASRVRSRCYFCEKEIEPDFRNEGMLIKFLTKRGKIRPRTRSGLCSRHQRGLSLEVKRGRNLGLLPYRIIA